MPGTPPPDHWLVEAECPYGARHVFQVPSGGLLRIPYHCECEDLGPQPPSKFQPARLGPGRLRLWWEARKFRKQMEDL